jgi:hypothetical protein
MNRGNIISSGETDELRDRLAACERDLHAAVLSIWSLAAGRFAEDEVARSIRDIRENAGDARSESVRRIIALLRQPKPQEPPR